ncbi:hypothetical protein Tco_0083991 [Tanacetum coccineum]
MKFGVSSWHGSRIDGRSCLLSGAIDGSEGNRIIRDSKLEFREFSFYLVPLSYGSVDNRILYGIITRSDVDLRRLVSFDVFRKARGVERLHELQDDRGVTEGREDVREVFQQRRSGAKRKLSKCGRNQMGNELILALPEGADDFVSRWMKLFSEYGFKAKYHLGKENVVVESWSRKKSEPKNEFWIDHGMERNVGYRFMGRNSFRGKLSIHSCSLSKESLGVLVEVGYVRFLVDLRTVEFVDREVKSLKRSKIVLVQFRWNSKRGPEFTWERKDQIRSKCPQLFVDSDIASSS